MSKFINAIEAQILPSQRSVRVSPKCNLSASTEISDKHFSMQQAYRVEVVWKQIGFCLPKDLSHVKAATVELLREEIYGDMRKMILDLELAIYENDIEAALSRIRDMKAEILGGEL